MSKTPHVHDVQAQMTTYSSCTSNAACAYAGTHHDLVEALVFTRPGQVDLNIINGRIIVQDGKMLTVDIPVSVMPYNCDYSL